MRTLLALAALATLTACGGGGDSDSRRDRDQARSERDRDRDSSSSNDERSSRDERRGREVDPDLEDELRTQVREYRETLPARDGPLTITDVDLDGTEIIYTGRIDANFDRAAVAEFRRTMSREMCTGEPAEVIRRGGSFTYNLSDEDGDEVDTTVSSCD